MSFQRQSEATPMARPSSLYDAASVAILVVALSMSTTVAIGEFCISLVVWLAAIMVMLVLSGRVYLRILGFHRRMERSFIATLLAGMASFGFLVAFVRLVFPMGLGASTGWVVFAECLLYALFRPSIREWSVRGSTQRVELIAVAMAVVSGVLYVQHYLPPTELDGDDIVFHPLRDFFTHANMANVLMLDGDASVVGRPGLAGIAPQFYHYAGYVLVALPAWLVDVPIYPLLLGLWTPLGLCLVGLAAYALGRTVFGRLGGMWSLVVLLVLPDPSYWTFGFGEVGIHPYSMHRVLQIAPTNAFGLAVAACGMQLLLIGLRQKALWAAAAGWTTCGMSIYFKAQVFIAAFPIAALLFAYLLLKMTPRSRWPAFGGVMAALVVVVYLLFPIIEPYAPNLASEPDPGGPLCRFLETATASDIWIQPIAKLVRDAPSFLHIPLRAFLILFVTFRMLLVLAIVPLTIRIARGPRWNAFDIVVAGSLVLYLCYAMLIRPHRVDFAWGWPWNLQQVPFLWSHFVLTTWTVGGMVRGLGTLWPRGLVASPRWLPFLLAIPLMMGRGSLADDWLRDQLWTHMPQPKGLVMCAQFIREHAAPLDRFQDSEDDPYLFVEALSERRPFCGWTVVATYSGRDRVDPLFRERLAIHQAMRQATTLAELTAWREKTGIRWYLLHPQTKVAWPLETMPTPAFESDGYRVYDLDALN